MTDKNIVVDGILCLKNIMKIVRDRIDIKSKVEDILNELHDSTRATVTSILDNELNIITMSIHVSSKDMSSDNILMAWDINTDVNSIGCKSFYRGADDFIYLYAKLTYLNKKEV